MMVLQVEHRQKIGEAECPCCKNTLDVRVNRQQQVYTICKNILRKTDTGKNIYCDYKMTYGTETSRILIEEFLVKAKAQEQKKNENEHRPDDKPAGQSGPGAPEPDPGPRNGDDRAGDKRKRGPIGYLLLGDK